MHFMFFFLYEVVEDKQKCGCLTINCFSYVFYFEFETTKSKIKKMRKFAEATNNGINVIDITLWLEIGTPKFLPITETPRFLSRSFGLVDRKIEEPPRIISRKLRTDDVMAGNCYARSIFCL